MEIEFEKIENRPINYVEVLVTTNDGFDKDSGDYSSQINAIIGSFDLADNDAELVSECIDEGIDNMGLSKCRTARVIVKESGEFDGFVWHKYYVIERVFVYAGEH